MKKETQHYFITWLRAAATIAILLCHFANQSNNVYINMTSQFFNIGVQLFLIISGFLFGTKNEKIDLKWYKKRFKRIYIPYELFVFILFLIFLILGKDIRIKNWIFLVLGMQGTVVDILGAEHTWFISEILICYLLTPIIDKISQYTTKKCEYLINTIVVILGVLLVITLIPVKWINTLGILLIWYTLAFLLGKHFKQLKVTFLKVLIAIGIVFITFAIRIGVRIIADGTFWYDALTASYTHGIAAFAILYIFMFLFEDKKPVKVVEIISDISFEVYLYHYMFCVGPLRLFDQGLSWFVSCFIVTIMTGVVAFFMNKATKLRSCFLNRRKYDT